MKTIISALTIGSLKVRLIRDGKDEFVEFFTQLAATKPKLKRRPKFSLRKKITKRRKRK